MREVAGGALSIGLPNGDVEAAVTDGVIGAAEAARIAQFGEDRRRGHRADTVELAGQGTAAGLAAGEGPQRAVDRRKLAVELVEHPQVQVDGLAACGRQLDARKRIASGGGARLEAGRHALVEELRLQPLQPGRALIDQRLAQPRAGAQLEDLHGRDPRLRQLASANVL